MSYIFVMVIFSWAGGLQHQVLTSAESLIEDGDSSVAVGIVQMRRKAALHSIKKLMKRGIKLPKDYTMEIGFTNTPITMDSMAISELMKELVKISHVLTDGVEDALGDDPPSSVVALWTAVEYVVGKLKEYFPACDAHSLTELYAGQLTYLANCDEYAPYICRCQLSATWTQSGSTCLLVRRRGE
eukprot:1372354-Amorphochlora_amoeboformis.AAC.3